MAFRTVSVAQNADAATFAALGLILGAIVATVLGRRRAGPTWLYRPRRPPQLTVVPSPGPRDMRDPHAQLNAIARVQFETVKLLNREEARLLPLLERLCRAVGEGHRVMAQTSLGEVIRPVGDTQTDANREAYASINSKRMDFANIDRFGHLKVAIEYQGCGHWRALRLTGRRR